jgi:hypothetical protein
VGGVDHQGLVVDAGIVQAGTAAADQAAGLTLGGGKARAIEQVGDVDVRAKLAACDLGGRQASFSGVTPKVREPALRRSCAAAF